MALILARIVGLFPEGLAGDGILTDGYLVVPFAFPPRSLTASCRGILSAFVGRTAEE